MDTQVMNVSGNGSGPQPSYSPRGPVNPGVSPQGVSPQAQSASSPLWNPPGASNPSVNSRPPVQRMSGPGMPRNQVPDYPRPRPEPVPSYPQRSVQERHEAFQRAAEALHDRHYEDNNIRLEAELRLAEFFLS